MRLVPMLAAAMLAGCAREERRAEKPPTPVAVAAVEQITPRAGERFSASILPEKQVTLSFRVGGIVEWVHQTRGPRGGVRLVQIGDVVQAGTPLARLRPKDYDLQLAQAGGQVEEARRTEQAARAQLAQAEVAAAKAALDFQRATTLMDSRSLTKPDYDAAKAQYDATRAQVEAARAQLQAVAARISTAEAAAGTATLARQDTVIAAPFTGAVVQRNIEVGALASPGAPAITLACLSSVKAAFGVPDVVAVTLKPGLVRSLSVEALPGRQFSGAISAIAAVADASTRLFQVDLTIPNPNGVLRPGMIAALTLAPSTAPETVLVVPLAAIVRAQPDGSGFAVMVVEGGHSRRRAVTLGQPYGDRIAVASGVKAGERVVARGASMLAEGERVEVMP